MLGVALPAIIGSLLDPQLRPLRSLVQPFHQYRARRQDGQVLSDVNTLMCPTAQLMNVS
jgi:hypothetical protein